MDSTTCTYSRMLWNPLWLARQCLAHQQIDKFKCIRKAAGIGKCSLMLTEIKEVYISPAKQDKTFKFWNSESVKTPTKISDPVRSSSFVWFTMDLNTGILSGDLNTKCTLLNQQISSSFRVNCNGPDAACCVDLAIMKPLQKGIFQCLLSLEICNPTPFRCKMVYIKLHRRCSLNS